MNKVRHLVWREGRPRWEPSPSAKALGFRGQDLKDVKGNWLARSAAEEAAEILNARLDERRREGRYPRGAQAVNDPVELDRRASEVMKSREKKIRKITATEISRNRSGYIYFYWIGETIKIGFSVKPLRRLLALETAASLPPGRIAVLPGTLADERRLHKRFDQQRSHGEWFRATAHLNEIVLQMFAAGTTDIP